MPTDPATFIRQEIERDRLKDRHLVELVKHWQRTHKLEADGKPGAITRGSIDSALAESDLDSMVALDDHLLVDDDGWLVGSRVVRVPMHHTWRGGFFDRAGYRPAGIVAHYTATDPGTAMTMARRKA